MLLTDIKQMKTADSPDAPTLGRMLTEYDMEIYYSDTNVNEVKLQKTISPFVWYVGAARWPPGAEQREIAACIVNGIQTVDRAVREAADD